MVNSRLTTLERLARDLCYTMRMSTPPAFSLTVHLIPFWVDETEPQMIAERLDAGIRLTWGDAPPEDCHLLVTGRLDSEHLEACPDLKWVIVPWAGVSKDICRLLSAYAHISVHNLHYNAADTAEMALALLLAASKTLIPADRALRAANWRYRSRPDCSLRLEGKTALILGYGEIGRRIGRALQGMGMRILGVRRDPQGEMDVYSLAALHDLLPQAEVLILTLPLTDETRAIIGARELDLLPERAILVNVGRGPLVDQEALYQALRAGRLFAAGLDVWYNYPRDEAAMTATSPADFPFDELDNVVMSPHRGGSSLEADRLRVEQLAAMINAAARGEPLPNRVDVRMGY